MYILKRKNKITKWRRKIDDPQQLFWINHDECSKNSFSNWALPSFKLSELNINILTTNEAWSIVRISCHVHNHVYFYILHNWWAACDCIHKRLLFVQTKKFFKNWSHLFKPKNQNRISLFHAYGVNENSDSNYAGSPGSFTGSIQFDLFNQVISVENQYRDCFDKTDFQPRNC